MADGWQEPYEAGYRLTLVKAGTNEATVPNWPEQRIGNRILAREAGRRPTLNIGIDCGASRIVVIDTDDDDPALTAEMIAEFGETPMGVWTPSGGAHLYYQCVGVGKGSLRHHPEPKWCRPVDILGEGAMAVAPPSVRPHGSYRLMNPSLGWVRVDELPILDPSHPLLKPWATGSQRRQPVRRTGNVTQLPAYTGGGIVEPGQRGRVLLSELLRALKSMDGAPEAALMAKATIAARLFAETRLADNPEDPFTEGDLDKAIRTAVTYTLEGRNFAAGRGTHGRILADLATFGSDASAIVLLAFLRETHRKRDHFILDAAAMAGQGTLNGWTAYQIKTAIKALLDKGRIEKVHQGTGRGNPSIYALV